MIERFYRSLYLIRRVEEEIAAVYPTDKIKSPVHPSIGQEAVSVAVCEALKPDDIVFGSYRSHALYLAKGGDLKKMIAELYGKVTGCAKGKGGSMHLIDVAGRIGGRWHDDSPSGGLCLRPEAPAQELNRREFLWRWRRRTIS